MSDNTVTTSLQETAAAAGVPLAWVHSTSTFPYANLGDALSAVVVCAISGHPIKRASFRSTAERIGAIGTIGHSFIGGVTHLWGTGIDSTVNVLDPETKSYRLPPNTTLIPHAVRGPFTRETLVAQGVDTPRVYGDPAWFMPTIYNKRPEVTHDLGVVLHISELTAALPDVGPRDEYLRYRLPDGGPSIKLINTYHRPTYDDLCSKMDDILSCRRIVSTSFHGLMLADAYRIPSAFFSLKRGGGAQFHPLDDRQMLDHRVADFYAGAKSPGVTTYQQPRNAETDWMDVINYIDAHWRPLTARFDALLNSFPLERAQQPSYELLKQLAL